MRGPSSTSSSFSESGGTGRGRRERRGATTGGGGEDSAGRGGRSSGAWAAAPPGTGTRGSSSGGPPLPTTGRPIIPGRRPTMRRGGGGRTMREGGACGSSFSCGLRVAGLEGVAMMSSIRVRTRTPPGDVFGDFGGGVTKSCMHATPYYQRDLSIANTILLYLLLFCVLGHLFCVSLLGDYAQLQ